MTGTCFHRAIPPGLPTAVGVFFALLVTPVTASDVKDLSFAPQTGFVILNFDTENETAAVAGRDDAGQPRLALIASGDASILVTEYALPDDAVAIDAGANGEERDVLFVLCATRVLQLDAADGELREVSSVTSLYRGISYAPLTSELNFARDIDDDAMAELVVQDFDVVTVLDGDAYSERRRLALPTLRRSFERAQNYRPARTALIPGAMISVRGDQLLRYDLTSADTADQLIAPIVNEMGLGLSSEREIERFYNGDPELDQRDVLLREPELLTDLTGDGLPDLVTLETVSSGVFDKETTYRLYVAKSPYGFDTSPDTVFSGSGYQFGLRTVALDEERTALVAPGIRIGLGAIIGALFSRSVSIDIAIYSSDGDSQFAAKPTAEVSAKVRFDFGSGQVELPTVAFGDLNGDGQQDLILKRGREQLEWRRNLGEGTFVGRGETFDILAPKDGFNVIAADFDGDGRDEILVRYGLQDGNDIKRRVRLLDPGNIDSR
ncbi:MAG: VCBS repeat-containing protein [Pseudomonadota bacterium]